MGSAVWIGFAENKSWAMVLAMVALILARTLYVGSPTGTAEENPGNRTEGGNYRASNQMASSRLRNRDLAQDAGPMSRS